MNSPKCSKRGNELQKRSRRSSGVWLDRELYPLLEAQRLQCSLQHRSLPNRQTSKSSRSGIYMTC
jgi:hypothetical protein